ncbi:MAG: hypothetical protein HRU19_23570 [Pseudobacteriovorax sp.]|nr:hypothetical protein [Pseudobacteriovorax sp.]
MNRLKIDQDVKGALLQRLKGRSDFISFQKEPQLASLCCCLGLDFEIGRPDYDRLSALVGLAEPNKLVSWSTEFVESGGEIGIIMTPPNSETLLPQHPDLSNILDRKSMNTQGQINRLVIFPHLVANHYYSKGLDLGILPEWMLSLLDPSYDSSYFVANLDEANNNIVDSQLNLLTSKRLVFSGTHDISDHLIGFHTRGLNANHSFFLSVQKRLNAIDPASKQNASYYLLSYLVAVLLDDLAQPLWYESDLHKTVIKAALQQIESEKSLQRSELKHLPHSFHKLVASMRQLPKQEFVDLSGNLNAFFQECRGQ